MIVEFNLDEEDLLTHQLFAASNSERIKKKRFRNRIVVPLFYFALALVIFLLFRHSYIVAYALIGVGILWFFIYPFWEKGLYVRHYKGFIREKLSENIGRDVKITISGEFIHSQEGDNESKISLNEIKSVDEIKSAFYVNLKTGYAFVFPKNKISNTAELKNKLQQLAAHLKVNYTIDENWTWK